MATNTMATIEPRLIHLLNGNDQKDQLPSIHSTLGGPNAPEDANALLLPPLELTHSDSSVAAPGTAAQQQLASVTSTNTAFTLSGNSDDPLSASAASASVIGKRPRVLPHTEELIQLPQPLKKQKSTQQVGSLVRHFPPIISGLHEPPPNAAVFPPIASAEFDTDQARSRGSLSQDFHASGATITSTNSASGGYLYDGMLSGSGVAMSAEPDRLEAFPQSTTTVPSHGMGGPTLLTSTMSGQLANPSTPTRSLTGESAGTPPALSESSSAATLSKQKRRATKPRRRWTDEETNQLLLGVSRHGLGKWTAILEDPDFSFSNRSAGDLKDRFRTCCPDELRGKLARGGGDQRSGSYASASAVAPSTPGPSSSGSGRLKTKTSLSLEDILIESEEQAGRYGQNADTDPSAGSPSDAPKSRKRRVHRRNMEDMVKLGIHGPFKKSERRERRPFTEQDDREILEGLQIYGPAWTKIHRHPAFSLSSRQPTDLRDRVRNKYPETYANIEKGIFPTMPPELELVHNSSGSTGGGTGHSPNLAKATHPMEPVVSTTTETPRTTRSARPSHDGHPSGLREALPRRPHTHSQHGHSEPLDPHDPSVFDINEPSNSAFLGNMGEMGISRLLLDDTKPSNSRSDGPLDLSWSSPVSS